MSKHKSRSPQGKRQAGNRLSLQIIVIIALVIAATLYFFWHQNNFQNRSGNTAILETPANGEISIPAPSTGKASSSTANSTTPQDNQRFSMRSPDTSQPPPLSGTKELEHLGEQPAPPAPPANTSPSPAPQQRQGAMEASPDALDHAAFSAPSEGDGTPLSQACSKSAGKIANFYAHLDRQAYIRDFEVSPSSRVYFTSLIQRLLDHPPVVSGETDDLYTILQNTAHFFRIIGKENILLLKGILDMEKDRFEDVLREFYALIHIPSCPEKSFNLHIPEDALYNYAGFFLNTMGGRLYLFRRDSMSRMVVSYYSILLIDEANKNASNRHGIEITGAIDRLIEEMESTTNTLRLKDTYLDKLYDLKEEYQ